MTEASNNLSLSALSLKTAKAKGLGATNSNVVEDLSSSVTAILGETYWSTSSMTKSTDGRGNTKQIVYATNEGKVYTVNPATGFGSTKTLLVGETAFPACKLLSDDYDYCITEQTEALDILTIKSPISSGQLDITNPHSVDAVVINIAYRCSSNSSEFSVAAITLAGSDYKLSCRTQSGSQMNADLTIQTGSTLALFIDNTNVSVIETKTNGDINIFKIVIRTGVATTIAMQTTGLTGKICDPLSTNTVFYGYKADGLYSVTGTNAPVKAVNVNGITGIAVFTKYGSGCETGYIYREADNSTCRDNTGKRTAPVTGTMINDYKFSVVKMLTSQTANPN